MKHDPDPGRQQLHGVRALRLRQLDAGMARLAKLVGAGKVATIGVGDARVQLRLAMLADTAAGEHEAGAPLSVDSLHGPLEIAPGADLIHLLSGIAVPDGAAADPQLQHWIAACAAACLPPGWQALFGMRVAFPGHAGGTHGLTLHLAPERGGWSFDARLSGSAATLCALACASGWRSAAGMAAPDRLPVRRAVLAGSARLSLEALRAIAAGDLLLIEKPAFGADGNGSVEFGRDLSMKTRLVNTGTTLQLHFNAWSTSMDNLEPNVTDEGNGAGSADAPDQAGEGGAPLEQLLLRLTFEVGTMECSLGQLRQFAPGSVITLAGSVPPMVVVRCGQAQVARGELVEVEGRLAVQITGTGELP